VLGSREILACAEFWWCLGGERRGGYFRQFGASRVNIRKIDQGWYAVRQDGRVLGNAAQVAWFASGSDAFAAVEREHCTSFDADPFRDFSDRHTWLTIKRGRAA